MKEKKGAEGGGGGGGVGCQTPTGFAAATNEGGAIGKRGVAGWWEGRGGRKGGGGGRLTNFQ